MSPSISTVLQVIAIALFAAFGALSTGARGLGGLIGGAVGGAIIGIIITQMWIGRRRSDEKEETQGV